MSTETHTNYSIMLQVLHENFFPADRGMWNCAGSNLDELYL